MTKLCPFDIINEELNDVKKIVNLQTSYHLIEKEIIELQLRMESWKNNHQCGSCNGCEKYNKHNRLVACDNCPKGEYCKRCLCYKCPKKTDCPGYEKCLFDDNGNRIR